MTQRVRLTDKTASSILAEKVAAEAQAELEKNLLPAALTEASAEATVVDTKEASMEGDKELLPKSEGADYSIQDPDKDLVDNSPIGKDDEKSREEQQGKVAAIKVAHAKAVKCLTAADRMFPTAAEDVIVKTAVSLMKYMPMGEIDALMGRQAEYAAALAKQAEEMVPAEKVEKEILEAGKEATAEIPAEEILEDGEKVATSEIPAEEILEDGEKVATSEIPAEEILEDGEKVATEEDGEKVATEEAGEKDPSEEDWKAKYAALEAEVEKLKAAADKKDEVTFEDAVKTASAKSAQVDEIFQSVVPGFQPKISSLAKTASSKEENLDQKLARLFQVNF